MPDNNGSRPTMRSVQRETPADLPHGPVRTPAQCQQPVSMGPDTVPVLQLLEVAGALTRRLDAMERRMSEYSSISLKDRQKALAAARRHVANTREGRIPMTTADRIKAEVMVAWFLVGEHGPDPD